MPVGSGDKTSSFPASHTFWGDLACATGWRAALLYRWASGFDLSGFHFGSSSPGPWVTVASGGAVATLMHHLYPPSSSGLKRLLPRHSFVRAGHWWLTPHSQVPLWELSLKRATLPKVTALPRSAHIQWLVTLQFRTILQSYPSSRAPPMGLADPLLWRYHSPTSLSAQSCLIPSIGLDLKSIC